MTSKNLVFTFSFLLAAVFAAYVPVAMSDTSDNKQWKALTPEEERVIVRKGTETPYTGEYTDHKEKGTYLCRRCGAELYRSEDKFDSRCGWPSFDDEIPGAVKRELDADGRRIEIICANCEGHLGHVFEGEGFTEKNTRHCVNSISMTFRSAAMEQAKETETGIFASGCFWGTEYYLQRMEGVIDTEVGYIGGTKKNPTYEEVCTGKTGHAEAVRVTYDPAKTSYEKVARMFFETHDPTQVNRQGPDIGTQYRSGVFYLNDAQKETAEKLVSLLREKGLKVATEITPATTFWKAEKYHEDYYNKTGGTPYCHAYRKLF